GNGQGYDPVNRSGNWHGGASFVGVFTQAPAFNAPPGLTGGGLDDRFDFQLVTGALFDGRGIDYATGTYHTFAVNGSVPVRGSVNDARNTALPDLSNRQTVLNLLTTVSDHLPVVADYVIVAGSGPPAGGSPPPSTGIDLVAAAAALRMPSRTEALALHLTNDRTAAVVASNSGVVDSRLSDAARTSLAEERAPEGPVPDPSPDFLMSDDW